MGAQRRGDVAPPTREAIQEYLKRAIRLHKQTGTEKISFNAVATLASNRFPGSRSMYAEHLQAMDQAALKEIGYL